MKRVLCLLSQGITIIPLSQIFIISRYLCLRLRLYNLFANETETSVIRIIEQLVPDLK